MELQIDSWLDRIFANSAPAMALTKSLLQAMHADASLRHAAAAGLARSTEDSSEGIAAFQATRKPVFRSG